MQDEKKVQEIRKKLSDLAKDFRADSKADPVEFLKKTDALTHDYYKAQYPELNA